MRAFSYISVIGSLALATFTSAAPQPIVVENGLVARGSDGCDTCGSNFLEGIIAKLEAPCSSITSTDSNSGSVDVDGLKDSLQDIITTLGGLISETKSNPHLLDGLDQSSCNSLLSKLINLIVDVVKTVLGLLDSCSPDDQDSLKALLTTLFSLVGDLVCVVLGIVAGLLGAVGSIVGDLLGELSGSVDLSGILGILTGCQGHWPEELGGSVSANGLAGILKSLGISL